MVHPVKKTPPFAAGPVVTLELRRHLLKRARRHLRWRSLSRMHAQFLALPAQIWRCPFRFEDARSGVDPSIQPPGSPSINKDARHLKI